MSERSRKFARDVWGIEFPPFKNPEDYGLPPYPRGEVIGPCVCGSWPGGECLKCPVITSEDDQNDNP